MTDNECTMLGWTEAMVSNGEYDLHISHEPNIDLGGTFLAFDHDMQEMININGWQITDYERVI